MACATTRSTSIVPAAKACLRILCRLNGQYKIATGWNNRDAAIKIILGRFFEDAAMQRRFAREAAVLARLEHRNIVRLYDYGDLHHDGAFLVMEMLNGMNLRKALPQLRGNPALLAPSLHGILDGLSFAHSRGVIHRDLKPENCFVVGDFGSEVHESGFKKF